MTIQVEINGEKRVVTSTELFQLAANGEIGPKTRVWVDSKETTCDNVSGIKFGAQAQTAPTAQRVDATKALDRNDPRVIRTPFIDYYIGGGASPYLICFLDAGRSVYSSNGGRVWRKGPIETQTNATGGIFKSIGRALTGESLFMSNYVAQGPSEIAFATKTTGMIVAKELSANQSLLCQKGAFLAATPGVKFEVYFQKKIGAGFLGGEGFLMQKMTGPGVVFLELCGAAYEYDLKAGEQVTCDTGAMAWCDSTCSIDVVTVKGLKNMFLGGEGFFDTVITGPGKATFQSMNIPELAQMVARFIPQSK